MKRLFAFFVAIVVFAGNFYSCKDSAPSFEELKRDERKIIDRIIAEKGIEVLKTYPASGVFGEKQFVELDNGIYLNVVDSGNGNRAETLKTVLLLRGSGEYYMPDTVISFNTFSNTGNTFPYYGYIPNVPMEFKYGRASLEKSMHGNPDNIYYFLFGTGLESILSHVGDSAVVKLIVPGYSEEKSYPVSSSFQTISSYYYVPIYFDKLRYVFKK